MGKQERVPNRRHTEESKTEAARWALSTGGNAAATRLGFPQSTMTNGFRQSREGASAPVPGPTAAVERPASELEAENARLPIRMLCPHWNKARSKDRLSCDQVILNPHTHDDSFR